MLAMFPSVAINEGLGISHHVRSPFMLVEKRLKNEIIRY